MPFPFIPLGAMVAMLVLGGTFALFFVAVNKIDRTITDVGGVVVGRLVSGFGDWSDERGGMLGSVRGGRAGHATGGIPADDAFEAAAAVSVEPARMVSHGHLRGR